MNLKFFITGLVIFSVALGKINLLANEQTNTTDPRTDLETMDKRTPIPLLPHMALHQKQNMREHLESIQGIITALQKKDFKAIAESASKMGFTPEMGRMCEHMGAGAPGFTEKAIRFHKTADTIVLAAKRHDQKGVFTSLNNTLTQCTSCHAIYRQQVVNEETMKLFTDKISRHSH